MKLYIRLLLVALALTFVLAACSTKPTPVVSPLGTPKANVADTSPVATPTVEIVLPTPESSDKGTVGGIVIRRVPGKPEEAIVNVRLFLAPLINSSAGKPAMAALDKLTSPQAVSDKSGKFVFSNVPPGSYGLIYETPINTVMLKMPDTNKDYIIEVKGGQVLNLKTVYIIFE